MNRQQLDTNWIASSPLNSIRWTYRQRTGAKFVVGDHHRIISDALERVIGGETKRLIINIAPRYSKTEMVSIGLSVYGFMINPRCRFIHTSYSADLALRNSETVKDIIKSDWFQKMFPCRIMQGSDSKAEWDTEQGGGFYAVSALGQITGFGAGQTTDMEGGKYRFSGAVIIDDPIKPMDALNDNAREKVNLWYDTTIRSRLNSRNTPVIVIMQRLHLHDLCGYLTAEDKDPWEVVSLPVLDENDNALWPYKHTAEELKRLRETIPFVFNTQYQQHPTPAEGLMYREFKTYSVLPDMRTLRSNARGRVAICNVTDSADRGSDNLCSIDYIDTPEACYVLDVIYTDKPTEHTEPMMAKMLIKDQVQVAHVESNNGGGIFSRNVERLCRAAGNFAIRFHNYPQTRNKETRIFTAANEVNNLVVFPEHWQEMWPQFAREIVYFLRAGRNAHDDGADCLTSIWEHHGRFGSIGNAADYFG